MNFTLYRKSDGKKVVIERTCVGWTVNKASVIDQLNNSFPMKQGETVDDYEIRVYFSQAMYPSLSHALSLFKNPDYQKIYGVNSDQIAERFEDIKEWHQNLLKRSVFRFVTHDDNDGKGPYFVMKTTFLKGGDSHRDNASYGRNCVLAALLRNCGDYPVPFMSFYLKTMGSKKSATALLVAASIHALSGNSHATFLPSDRWKGAFSKGEGKGIAVIRKLMEDESVHCFGGPSSYFSQALPISGISLPSTIRGNHKAAIDFVQKGVLP